MPTELHKALPIPLRSLGLNEKWLQDRISDDPTILDLGELEIAGKEHHQPLGGRIDFLMRNVEEGTYYEVEVMLGSLDESHIIRTLEYWDVERQRRPHFDHRAVIVAEQITARFFNVLRLLNSAVPMIAVQLSAFQIDDKVFLHPVTVLDIPEESILDDVDGEVVDRAYWEKKSSWLLPVVDSASTMLRDENLEPHLTYNRLHIALATTGYNFCWFHPRKAVDHSRVEIRLRGDSEGTEAALSSLTSAGMDAAKFRLEYIGFSVTPSMLQQHSGVVTDVLKKAEEASRKQ